MRESRTVAIETVVRSNEKLIKALITLLSLKDEHLMDELKTIFSHSGQGDSAFGSTDIKVTNEIQRGLHLVDELVQRLNAMPDDEDVPATAAGGAP